jgi:starvation-inducible DNA-binding protein
MTAQKNHEVIKSLSRLLAGNFTLFLKTQNYHWNVVGPHFASLHILFEGQYNELFAANDEIAERLRALGERAPASFTEFQSLADVKEDTGAPDYKEMLKNLARDNEKMAALSQALATAATEIGDDATADLANGRTAAYQKAHWMLEAHLK